MTIDEIRERLACHNEAIKRPHCWTMQAGDVMNHWEEALDMVEELLEKLTPPQPVPAEKPEAQIAGDEQSTNPLQ